MAECSECGKQTMSFTCHYCGEKFCSDHRLPENHDCEGLESGKKEEYMAGDESNSETNSSKSSEAKAASPDGQKWFKQKNLKEETGGRSRRPQPSLKNDILDVFRNNLTYTIIAVTVAFFFLQPLPGIFENMVLRPGLSDVLQRPWTLFTVMLLHGNFFHLFANMVTFYFFGSTLERSIGGKDLLKFYIGTGLASSIGYVAFSNLVYLLHGSSAAMSPAVGASGAVVAAVGAVAVLYPDAEVLLYFVIPMKIKTAVYAFGALETVNLVAKLANIYIPIIGGFASSAHLTGLILGIYLGKKYRERVNHRASARVFR
jgi:membrane associated rhomboid family serine protease